MLLLNIDLINTAADQWVMKIREVSYKKELMSRSPRFPGAVEDDVLM